MYIAPPTRRLVTGLIVLVLASSITVAVLSGGHGLRSSDPSIKVSASPPATAATQPKITWSQQETDIAIPQGDIATKNVTFTSTTDLTNITIEPVPEIVGLLNVEPKTVSYVTANQPQSVRISFAVPLATTVGTYEGTIRVRSGSQTRSQTLKVVLRVVITDWESSTNPTLGITLLYPPILFSIPDPDNPSNQLIQSSPQEIVLGGALPEDPSVQYTTSGFVIAISSVPYTKPFAINQYLTDIHPSSEVDTLSNVVVSGIASYQVTFRDEEGAGEPTVVVPLVGRVLEISYVSTFGLGSLEEQQGLFFYNQILLSLQIL
jgi:hypothetical protein